MSTGALTYVRLLLLSLDGARIRPSPNGDCRKVDVQEVRQLVERYPSRCGDNNWRGVDLWRVNISCRDDRCVRANDRGERRLDAAP